MGLEKTNKANLCGYCGLYCGACFIRKVHQTGDRKYIPPRWSFIEQPDCECLGCRSNQVFGGCNYCPIRMCAQERMVDHCNICSHYACELFESLEQKRLPHHFLGVRSLSFLNTQEVEKWLIIQEQRWKCPICGHPCTHWEALCEKCGNKLINCEEEAFNLGMLKHK